MIHGGAGVIRAPERYVDRFGGLSKRAVEAGGHLLDAGASALDVLTHCVTLLDDDFLYNTGRGSVLNVDGVVECDASIMDGRTLDAGAVAGVRGFKNPILLARAIMEKSQHVFLIGEGAARFGREHGISFESAEYFLTDERIAELAETKKERAIGPDYSHMSQRLFGAVGAVARDKFGNLAADTSTGGVVNQHWGRVGDSAVIGAGTFADNASCAASCTGVGEHILRTSLARTVAFFVEYHSMCAEEAARAAIQFLVDKVQGLGGLIIIDRDGACARAHLTPGMRTAMIENGKVRLQTT